MARLLFVGITKGINLLRRIVIEPGIKKSFKRCGCPVRIASGCLFSGIENISVGDHVYLGNNLKVLTTRAQVILGNHIMFGPGVSIITGNHRTDIIGKYMTDVTDEEKRAEDDQDVVIEDDVWVGANVTILKGVTIGRGSVVAAGALVTEGCPPYSVIGGVPARVIKKRFAQEEIIRHETILKSGRN